MVDVFGLVQADGGGNPTENMITAPDHALANGGFGVVTNTTSTQATGHYSTSDRTPTRSAATSRARGRRSRSSSAAGWLRGRAR